MQPFLFDVWECNRKIGTISRYGGHHYDFEYDHDYIAEGGHELCVTMPVSDETYKSNGLHPFFKNYISEGWLEEVQKTFTGGQISPETQSADVIAYYGQNCIGGLTFTARQHFSPEPQDILSDFEAKIAQNKSMLPGAHPKALVTEDAQGTFRVAQVDKYSTHIAKLPRSEKVFQTLLHNEFLTTRVVAALLPDDKVCDLSFGKLYEIDQDVLLIKRFDRTPEGEKIPFYEFNQLLGKAPDEKYDGSYRQMADYIFEHAGAGGKGGIVCDKKDLRTLFRRIAVAMLVGNTDAHLKNFALMKMDGKLRLTPNYDLLSSSMYADFKQVALEIGGKKVYNIGQVDAKRIIGLADEFRLSREELMADVQMLEQNLPAAYRVLDDHQQTSPVVADHIRRFMKSRWNGTFATIKAALKNPPKNLLHQTKPKQFTP